MNNETSQKVLTMTLQMISHQVGELARNGFLALTIMESSDDVQFVYFQ